MLKRALATTAVAGIATAGMIGTAAQAHATPVDPGPRLCAAKWIPKFCDKYRR